MDEYSTRTSQRDRLTWDARFALNAAWADRLQTAIAVQHADARQLGTTVRNTLPLRVRDNSYAEKTWQAGRLQADKTLRNGDWAHKVSHAAARMYRWWWTSRTGPGWPARPWAEPGSVTIEKIAACAFNTWVSDKKLSENQGGLKPEVQHLSELRHP